MDGLFRRQLDAIARDRSSGAAELALRAITALQAWLRRHPKPTESELLEIARIILRAQPSMASILRVANEVCLAIGGGRPAAMLSREMANFHSHWRKAPSRIAQFFCRWLSGGPRRYVITYSYSSTVAESLIRARNHIKEVFCSESRPGCEGIKLARRLAHAQINTTVMTDACLFTQTQPGCLLVLGADAVLHAGVAAKVGSRVLTRRHRSIGGTTIFLADTAKFWPERGRNSLRWMPTFGPSHEVWKGPPTKVSIYNPYFERVPFSHQLRLLTEHGWMNPDRIRRELRKIPISLRLKTLAD